jgi:hypothetical protein
VIEGLCDIVGSITEYLLLCVYCMHVRDITPLIAHRNAQDKQNLKRTLEDEARLQYAISLHCCHTDVTLLVHCGYTVVTLWLHWSYAGVVYIDVFVIMLSNCL